jgi:hypothetical protein
MVVAKVKTKGKDVAMGNVSTGKGIINGAGSPLRALQ